MPPRGDKHKIRRPKTSAGYERFRSSKRYSSVQQAISYDDEAIAEEDEEEHIELLEYEWPDLPPLPSMKDAVSRRRVSQGISYLLPVDKGKNSINNRFRTDLRAMFQEPYASDDLQYDDNRVKLSAKVHFLSNTADTKWTRQHLSSIPTHLNADCEGARKLYVHSAPTGGVASRRVGIDPTKLRKRSNLFLPVKASKAQVSPEIVKLREEAAKIIKEGLSYQEGDDDDQQDQATPKDHSHARKGTTSTHTAHNPFLHPAAANGSRSAPADSRGGTMVHTNDHHQRKASSSVAPAGMLTTFGGSHLGDSMGTSAIHAKLQNVHIQQEKFANYEDLKKSMPPKPLIPAGFESSFLSSEENQKVWDWLHHGESMTDFDYFLSICG